MYYKKHNTDAEASFKEAKENKEVKENKEAADTNPPINKNAAPLNVDLSNITDFILGGGDTQALADEISKALNAATKAKREADAKAAKEAEEASCREKKKAEYIKTIATALKAYNNLDKDTKITDQEINEGFVKAFLDSIKITQKIYEATINDIVPYFNDLSKYDSNISTNPAHYSNKLYSVKPYSYDDIRKHFENFLKNL